MCDRRISTLVLLLSALVLPAVGRAQPAPATPPVPAGPLTLEQVLDLSEARSEAIAIARAGVRRSEADEIRARSGLLPQLSATASYDRALASEFENLFTPSAPSCAPFTLNNQAPLEARVGEIERAIDCGAVGSGSFFGSSGDSGDGLGNLPFGRKNTWRVGLTFSQNVFSGGRNGARRDVARTGRESAEMTVTTERAQLLYDVTQAYYDAALSERLVTIAEASVQQADATLRQTQAGFDAGTQPEFEVLRARVTRDNQTPLLIRQRVNRDIALLRLKQLLHLPAEYDLRLADTLGDDSGTPPPVFAPRVGPVETALVRTPDPASSQTPLSQTPLPDRTVVSQAAAGVRASEASLRLTEAERMPSVSVNSSYGRVAYPSGVFPDSFRTNWTIGASVQVPILTGGRQRGDELAARATVEESRARLEQVQNVAALDTRAAWAQLIASRAAWEATAGTVQQATRAYEIADVRYRAGVSTQLELSDSRLLLQQAQANRAQAARDLQVARARVALLPDLPIGAAGGGSQTPQAPAQPQQQQPQTQPQTGGGQLTAASAGAPAAAGTR